MDRLLSRRQSPPFPLLTPLSEKSLSAPGSFSGNGRAFCEEFPDGPPTTPFSPLLARAPRRVAILRRLSRSVPPIRRAAHLHDLAFVQQPVQDRRRQLC